MGAPALFTVGNPKTAKGEAFGFLTAILHFAPFNLSGRQVCPRASAGCAAACLNTAGRGAMARTQEARVRRTRRYFEDRPKFVADLSRELEKLERRADRLGLSLAVRLNGTSDIPWERKAPELFRSFSHLPFYDYTKVPGRFDLPENYSLTFSRSESNESECIAEAARGRNIAAVFAADATDADIARTGRRYGLVLSHDMDTHDLRFLDPTPSLGFLRAKGKGRRDLSGFVIQAGT